jgi:hypothetical protein
VAGGCRILQDKEFRNFISSPDIVGVSKPGRVGSAGLVACMGRMRGESEVLVGKREGGRLLGGRRR